MALIFNTVFDDDYAAWTCADSREAIVVPHPQEGWGCAGGWAARCPAALLKLAIPGTSYASPLSTITVRFKYAVAGTLNNGTFLSRAIFHINNFSVFTCSSVTTGLFSSFVEIQTNGALRLRFDSSGGGFHDSAPGVVPTDGLYHGYQISMSFASHTCTFNIVIDNVSVLSGSHNSPVLYPTGYNGVSDLQIITNTYGVNSTTWYSSCAEFQLDNTVSIISYLGCATSPPCGAPFTLSSCEYPPAHITDLTYDCNTHQMHVIGTCFRDTAILTIGGRFGDDVAFDIVSRTETEIIIENLDPPFVSGQRYCATVNNG